MPGGEDINSGDDCSDSEECHCASRYMRDDRIATAQKCFVGYKPMPDENSTCCIHAATAI